MKKILVLVVLLLTVALPPVQAQTETTEVTPATPQKKHGFIPIPVLYYTPDTRLGLGAAVIGYMQLKSKHDSTYTRLSTARLLVDYTLNKQTDQQLEWSIFTREEKYLLRGELRHRKYVDRFYGIGNRSLEANDEKYEYELVNARLGTLKKFGKHTFAGLDFQFTNYYNVELHDGEETGTSILLTEQVPGYKGGYNGGVGAVFLYDSRDNVAFASSGIFLETAAYRFGSILGGDFDYSNYSVNFSKYFALKPNHVLGSNTFININTGETPLYRLAPAGGDKILRGYARNRFLDQNFAGTQVEYRFPVYKRFGMTTFAGLGDVFDKTSDVSFSTLKYSVGGGIRYALNQEQKLNIRADIGYGREGTNFYIVIGEAF
ncbi:outer membrane translocation and assembly module TamA [Pontibacter aydingkolensis]|uniref:BamA/TamA family outer membrane protein n=1 Tax=Pontibacter aydingkolensis TaxID=1911536 RepID=A0ABS7CU92_9BACT|nr:BamA/TamA family outer membrane protein [Pontibacter aydingkolensis]MBW7467392.1 BamA/TamA family outer membrane protein [Pontibacter aydingkolensis]